MPSSLLIRNAVFIDVEAGVARPGEPIAIRKGCFEAPVASRYDNEIDLAGLFVCPGLMDAHVHLFLDGGAAPLETFLAADETARMRVAAANAALAIESGITTVRDCGGPGDLVFRFARAIERGEIAGPRILAAGSPLTRPAGHCHFFGIEVATPADAARAVELQARHGAAFVKLIASGGGLTPGTSPAEADLPAEIMREAVRAARANGLQVAVHCHATESIRRAIEAGADTIEHASFTSPDGSPGFDPETAASIRDRGIVVSPTAISGVRIARTIRETGSRNGRDHNAVARLEARREHISRFRDAGVTLIAGSDCGVARTAFDSLADELGEFVRAGMSCADALRAATCDAARCLKQESIGQIRVGFAADLIVLRGNPLIDMIYLRSPLMVIRNGVILCDRRAPAERTTLEGLVL